MRSNSIRNMVTTAILIALTIVFQLLRPVLGGSNPVSTYIIGSLVNLALIVAACAVGLVSGVSVAVAAPLIALWQGHATLPMLPRVAASTIASWSPASRAICPSACLVASSGCSISGKWPSENSMPTALRTASLHRL